MWCIFGVQTYHCNPPPYTYSTCASVLSHCWPQRTIIYSSRGIIPRFVDSIFWLFSLLTVNIYYCVIQKTTGDCVCWWHEYASTRRIWSTTSSGTPEAVPGDGRLLWHQETDLEGKLTYIDRSINGVRHYLYLDTILVCSGVTRSIQ